LSTKQSQEARIDCATPRQGRTSTTHGTHSSCVGSTLRISTLPSPPPSLCNYALAADHAQPLCPRRQAIKYTSSYHCLTHTWGLRLKKLLDPCSGASPFRPAFRGFTPLTYTRGLRPLTYAQGLRPSTYARGLHPFDVRSGAPPLRRTLGGSAHRPT
jgi:hypothetical protein